MLNFNVCNGSVCYSHVDFSLPGYIAFEFERNYRSNHDFCGYLGWNWSTPLDTTLRHNVDGFELRDQWGGRHNLSHFGAPGDPSKGFTLARDGLRLVVTTPDDLAFYFMEGRESFLLEQIGNASGKSIRFDYSRSGNLSLMTDTMGRRISLEVADGRLRQASFLKQRAGNGASLLVSYSYDRRNNLIAVQDAKGSSSEFEYDGHRIVRYQNRTSGVQYAAYEAKGRCQRLWCEGDTNIRQVLYDDRRRSVMVVDARGASTVYRCHESGSVIGQINVLGIQFSNVISDANSQISSLDDQGKPILITLYDNESRTLTVSDAVGATTKFTEDPAGHLLSKVDACGGMWRWDYDDNGRVVKTARPSGYGSVFEYDEAGALVARTDAAGHKIRQTRSLDGRVVTLSDDIGLIVEYYYDDLGRYVGSADAAGPICRLELDAAGSVTKCTWPDESAIQYSYDAERNLTGVIDELGARTIFELDSFGNLLRLLTPDGNITSFEYDTEGDLTAFTNPSGETHRYHYDLLGRVVLQTFVDGRTETYTYDSRDRLIRIEQSDGTFIQAIYNAVGRITEKKYSDGVTEAFSYDQLRRLVNASNRSAEIRLKWDPDGNLVEEWQNKFGLSHGYDPVGNRVTSDDTLGRTLSYEYDRRRQCTQISDSVCGIYAFEFDIANLLRRHTYPNGASVAFGYDARKRVVAQELSGIGRASISASYSFDAASRLITQTTLSGAREELQYDASDHVLRVDGASGRTSTYSYMPSGRLSAVNGAAVTFGAGDRLISIGDTRFEYDRRGNIRRKSTPDANTEFRYDVAGRLTQLLHSGQLVEGYEYDPIGRRTGKSSGSGVITFAWDGLVPASEFSPEGTRTFLFDRARLLPLAIATAEQTEYLVPDRRGCVAAALGHDAINGTYEYDSFGSLNRSEGDYPSFPFRLKGQYFDHSSGLHYNFQRYYEPSTLRFITPDPIGLAGGSDVYAYGPNSWTWEDPFGLTSECQGDVFYRAMSDEEKKKVLVDCQLHAREKKKCPEGPYVTQTRAYSESAMREKPEEYQNLAEICTEPDTVRALETSEWTGRNGSQAVHFPDLPNVVKGQFNRVELKWERVGRPDQALNYGLSRGKGLNLFNSNVKSMKFTPFGETCESRS